MRKSIATRLPYHVEIWNEKESKLVGLIAQKYHANVQHSVGEQSYEPVHSLLERAKEQSGERPVRIYYISDYDPRGEYTIPLSVARKIEWCVNNLEEFKGMDVKLKKICLTREQVERFKLPPAPVKSSEPMAKRWRETCGGGVVELEAMETLHPREFVNLVEGELKRYIDEDVVEAIEEYNKKIARAIERYNEAVKEKIEGAYRKLDEAVERKAMRALKKFKARVEMDLEDELEELREAIEGWEEPTWKKPEENDEEWLYDSGRDYLMQLKFYKRARGARSLLNSWHKMGSV